jgi:hypothetical protein
MNKQEIYKSIKTISAILGLFFIAFVLLKIAPEYRGSTIVKDFTIRQISSLPSEPIKWIKTVSVSEINENNRFVEVPKIADNVKVSTTVSNIKTQSPLTNADRIKLSELSKERSTSEASLALAESVKAQKTKGFFASINRTFSKVGSMFATVDESSIEPEMVTVDILPVVEIPEETTPVVEEVSSTEEIITPTLDVEDTESDQVEEQSTSTEEVITEEATTTPEENIEEIITTTEEATTTEEQQTPSSSGGSSSTEEETESTPTPIIVEEATSTATSTDLVAVEYETPAPTIAEATTDTGKVVSISSENSEIPVTNVLAFTNIPEIYKVGQEDKIKIKWSNNNDKNVIFKAYDLNNNGKLDYVEWTVPHLSTQIFEIIFISKAFQLDANKEILADIYDTVKTQDNTWAPISDGQYVRVTFEKILTNKNDITIYAKPTGPTPVTIEAYTTDTNQLVATFNITEEGLYKQLIPDLQNPTDVFDLKIIGEVEIDYVVDPTVLGFTAHYNMDDTDGTTVIDSSGNNRNGTGTYTATTTGIIDESLEFDGVDDFVGVNYDLPRSASSISFWVKSLRNGQGIMQMSASDYKYVHYTDRAFFVGNGGSIIFDVHSSGEVLLTGGNVSDGDWHHVLATWDDTGKSLYVDTVLVDSALGGILPTNPMPYLTIGEANVGGVYSPVNPFFKGLIDNFTIYTKVLSQSEIDEIYAEGNIAISSDITPPVITVTSPTDNTAYKDFSIDFSVSAIDETSLGFIVPDLDSSLLSWWRMDDINGSTITDYTGNNNGTLYGASQTTGKFGKGMSLNGVDNYISIPHSDDFDVGSNDFTFSTWFYPTSNASQVIFASDTNCKIEATYSFPTGVKKLNIWAGNGSGCWGLINSDGGGNGIGTITMEPNNWYHIIYQREGSTFRTYINGVLDLQLTNITGSIVNRNEPFNIGRSGYEGGRAWNSGKIDEFLFFNRALSDNEINSLYNGSSIDHTLVLDPVPHTYKTYASDIAGNIASSTLNNFSIDCEGITTDGLYTVHKFICNDTFTLSDNIDAEILVVAGGGGGGSGEGNPVGDAGGGGGAGGLIYNNSFSISANSYPVVVGSGGLGSNIFAVKGTSGDNSSFAGLVAVGGGGGGSDDNATGLNGGSGGGAGSVFTVGNTGGDADYISPRQGYDGGNTSVGGLYDRGAAGGGGSGGPGGSRTSGLVGALGGVGTSISISGTPVMYAAGGDGGTSDRHLSGADGLDNTGNGGGGSDGDVVVGGNGGSGIVIIRYLTPDTTPPSGGSITYTNGYTTSPTITYTLGTDDISGINNSSGKIQRAEATLSNNVCSSFTSFSDLVTEYDGSYIDTSVVEGNCYKYQYLISDNIGNTATYTSANILKVDTSNPSVDIGINKTRTSTYTQTSTTSDAISGIASYLWSSDVNITFGATTSSSTTIIASTEGDHIIRLTVTDVAGNSLYDEYTLTWDSTPPVVSNISPAGGTNISRTNQPISFTISENGDCRLSTINKSYDDMSADVSCTSNSLLISCILPNFTSSGEKDIYIACKDSYNNADTASTTSHISYRVRSSNVAPITTDPIITTIIDEPVITIISTTTATTTPENIFNIQTASSTNSRIVTINITPNTDTRLIIISSNSDFSEAISIPLQIIYEYDLCQSSTNCPSGDYTIYAKSLDIFNVASPVVSTPVVLIEIPIIEEIIEVIVPPIIPDPEVIIPPTIVPEETNTPDIVIGDTTNNNDVTSTTGNDGTDTQEGISVEKLIDDGIEIIKGITEEAKIILAIPAVSVTTKTITTVGVVAGTTATISTLAFATPITFSEVWFLPGRLFGLILGWLGVRRKSRPWGTVYDSVTKRPIDPAYVSLINQVDGKEVAMAITDIDGRYGFSAPKGKYTIIARKTNYIFPSVKINNLNFDEVYSNLYFGNEIIIGNDGDIITKDIPMDSQDFDWNEFAKNKQGLNVFIKSKDIFWAKFSKIVFWLGFAVALLALLFVPAPYNYGIFALYIVLYVLNFFGFGSKKSGILKDIKTNSPLSFAIVKIFREGSDIEMIKKVADINGKYYCLIPNGSYYMKVEKKNIDGTYASIYQSDLFDVKRGIINMNVEI